MMTAAADKEEDKEEEKTDHRAIKIKTKKNTYDVFVRNLSHSTTDEQLSSAFSEIGLVKEAWVAREKGTQTHRGFGYVTFLSEQDLMEALKLNTKMEIDGRKIGIIMAKEKEKVDFKERKRIRRETKTNDDSNVINGVASAAEGGLGEERAENDGITTARAAMEADDDVVDKAAVLVDALPNKEQTKDKKKDANTTQQQQRTINRQKGNKQQSKHSNNHNQQHSSSEDEKKTVVIAGLKIGGEIKGVNLQKLRHFLRTDKHLKKTLSKPIDIVNEFDKCAEKSADDQTCAKYKIREDGATRGVILLRANEEKDVNVLVRTLHDFEFEETKKDKQEKKVNFEKRAKGERENEQLLTMKSATDDLKNKIWCRALVGEGANPKKHRVILRNLAFHATEKQIREAVTKYVSRDAFVWDCSIPIDLKTKKMRGFAFVAFCSAKDAVTCVEKMNGQKVAGRVVAVDVALSKRQEKENQIVQLKNEKELELEDNDDDENDSENDSESDDDSVDDHDDERDSSSASSSSSSSEDESESSDSEAEEEDEEEKMPDRFNKEKVPQQQQQQQNRTIFIRNLPLDATKDQLEQKLKQFGRIKSCRIVVDRLTNRSKGVAFCDFWDEASAKKCVDRCGDETLGEGGKKDTKSKASRKTPLLVAGRPVNIALAVSKEDAAQMMQKEASHWKGSNKEDTDKRNLYLAKEGQVHEGSSAAVGVSKSDLEKRKRGDVERQARLKNPNYYISKTRLSVRNVPAEFDAKLLKRAFLDATQKRASKNTTPKIINCKLLVDTLKGKAGMDIETGKQKHKGIGFVEFDTHEEAMTALRAMNNNPEVFSQQKRPIVEFAVEDARAVKKLEKRKSDRELQKKRSSGGVNDINPTENNNDDDDDDDDERNKNKSNKNKSLPSERVAKKVQRNLERKKLRNEARKNVKNGSGDGNGDGDTARPAVQNEITDKFKKRKLEHAKENNNNNNNNNNDGNTNKKAKTKKKDSIAVNNIVENDDDGGDNSKKNQKRKRGGDKRDATDDIIDMHMKRAAGLGLSSWL
jgi:nucleolar protein 4